MSSERTWHPLHQSRRRQPEEAAPVEGNSHLEGTRRAYRDLARQMEILGWATPDETFAAREQELWTMLWAFAEQRRLVGPVDQPESLANVDKPRAPLLRPARRGRPRRIQEASPVGGASHLEGTRKAYRDLAAQIDIVGFTMTDQLLLDREQWLWDRLWALAIERGQAAALEPSSQNEATQ